MVGLKLLPKVFTPEAVKARYHLRPMTRPTLEEMKAEMREIRYLKDMAKSDGSGPVTDLLDAEHMLWKYMTHFEREILREDAPWPGRI